MVRDPQISSSRFQRLWATLAAVTSILLAFTLAPAQRADVVREATVHLALADAGDGAIASPERASGKRLIAASVDPDPGVLSGSLPPCAPADVSPAALAAVASAHPGAATPDLPLPRGPPAPVA